MSFTRGIVDPSRLARASVPVRPRIPVPRVPVVRLCSKKCPFCKFEGHDREANPHVFVTELQNRRVRCGHCTSVMDRDEMAAVNLQILYYHWIETGSRPPYLWEAYWQRYDPRLSDLTI
jgi:hypothetical protein